MTDVERDNDDLFNTKWFRTLIISALLAGAGGGLSSFSKDTSDRYKGADADRDFRLRDTQIDAMRGRITAIESLLQGHLQHSAAYTQVITENAKDIERIERKLDTLVELERQEHGGSK